MIAVPAVDLRNGLCVQLVGGRPEDEKITLPDPVGVAREWRVRGFRNLHVVDLDAALGFGSNRDLIRDIISAAGPEITVQVGGGIRALPDAVEMFDAGAHRVIVGTRAIDDPEWTRDLAHRFPERIMVAADIRDGTVLRQGWTESSGLLIGDFLQSLASLPLAGVLCTDVTREGRTEGIDRARMKGLLRESPHPVWASGGISTMEELRFLEEAGARGAVLGMALYARTLSPDQVAKEFGG
jgi:phosphoribosylformimino-5-aminoimidazole carboxamide ribotide isomerase